MTESNADSSITMKLNRLDRRRMALMPVGLPGITASLNDPAVDVTEIFDGTDPAAGTTFTALGLRPPILTDREKDHVNVQVDGDVIGMSKAVISEIYNRDLPATFSAALGDQWEVEFMTHFMSNYSETSVLWVNPIDPDSNPQRGWGYL